MGMASDRSGAMVLMSSLERKCNCIDVLSYTDIHLYPHLPRNLGSSIFITH